MSVQNQNKVLTWTGRVMKGLIGLMLVFSGSVKLMNPPDFTKQWVDMLGYPADVAFAIGLVEIGCAVVYLIPQTAVLLTGYLGGAVATHVRIHDNFLSPAIGGVLVWLALYLRDPRIRALLPIRSSMSSSEPGE